MTLSDVSTVTKSSQNLADEKVEYSQSEDSSFYGNEGTRKACTRKLSDFDCGDYWRVHNWNIQVTSARERQSPNAKRKRQDSIPDSSEPKLKNRKSSMVHDIEHASCDKSKGAEPFNPYEGHTTALQTGERVEDFLQRLPPSSSDNSDQWIWCANFETEYRDTDRRVAQFKQSGMRLLEQFTEKRKSLEASFDPPKHPGAITRMLHPYREQLQSEILKSAKECRITTGKWMLFASPSRVDHYWAVVVRATVGGRLGISAKVSTKPSGKSESTHVICVYAQDFDDQADIKRILKELVRLKLAAAVAGPTVKGNGNSSKQIYFKADAYTWLDIMGDNEFKLKASMYSTSALLTEADVADLR